MNTPTYQHAFLIDNELYIRVIPAKSLFQSTLIHDVVNRGDIFAIRVSDCKLTIISGKATPPRLMVKIEPVTPTQLEMF